jgi:ATPase subunit of ABC transporter with duplicated ATPase domains
MHKPIIFKNTSLNFSEKILFDNFSLQITFGNKIGIIGRNGSGKSSLLKIISGQLLASSGEVFIDKEIKIGYLEQILTGNFNLSGAQLINKSLTKALSNNPDLLLLDEPSNHLDYKNRKSLIKLLQNYPGTLIIVTHDIELLESCTSSIWHIENKIINVFSGKYSNYIKEITAKNNLIQQELSKLNFQKRQIHEELMREQERAKKKKEYGQKKFSNDKLSLRAAQSKGEITHSKNLAKFNSKREILIESLTATKAPEIIIPKFFIDAAPQRNQNLIQINRGEIGYEENKILLSNINFSLGGSGRIAITGANGCGKTTLIRAILGEKNLFKKGDWHVLNKEHIGFLDQHYKNLPSDLSAIEIISNAAPNWPQFEIRKHLNNFLFRTNQEAMLPSSMLSGGEKTRLSLAQIAAKTPKLLILDEITNNLDIETKNHVAKLLKNYPGAIIIISHDQKFLEEISINEYFDIEENSSQTPRQAIQNKF